MNTIKNIFYFTVFLSFTCFAQEEDTLSYFPLQVGNLWQYYQPHNGDYFQVEVLSEDTSAEESSIIYLVKIRYAEIPHKVFINDLNTIYWKTSSDSSWSIKYKFNAAIGEAWISNSFHQYYTVYKGQDEDILFGQNVETKEFWLTDHPQTTLPLAAEWLAKGFGLYKSEFEVGATLLIGCIIDGIRYGTIVEVEENNNEEIINTYQLKNYPNPFNGQTQIYYSIPSKGEITIKVYNSLGQEIEELYRGFKTKGSYTINWKPDNITSGVYFVVLQTSSQVKTNKTAYLK
ncbi:MAG: T9SS type A sorting domain-containing protein [Melioribacteraceae bacterium]|nr:T9SS type A sorting domain-containing protein [Melioribacteraceae bacterium]MCF8357095.1 T9SS type A sorting domain-containing protein [Melioribacteraceae bacterium]MCF8395958.1 T9SS type A sorting domain-containing protein [Melioribacteraceae bacterium]MCF8419521.1 T9SS type A sorting domain-containing protein [Melioribacteraceae bacterium]